jgi:Asp-tRNA(Asn)/Glu-tRNA(Gln) amidotransferase A subunit family amidase
MLAMPTVRSTSRLERVRRFAFAACATAAIAGALPGRGVFLTAQQPAQGSSAPARPLALEIAEATIPDLQDAMTAGRVTSAELVDGYLARIDAYDQRGPKLNTIIRLNPSARAEASALDRERAERGARGPLHGIPVLLKDNYDMVGIPTTASSLVLAGLMPGADAFQVRKLKEAGAVILGKTNLHELASGIVTVSSLGGQTLNPYDTSRNPGGSSGGTGAAVSAGFAVVGWGSDTCGSIRIPASHNNLFGLRPTKGLSSVAGILPLSHTQDVAGPLARTARDLAIALDATIGPDPADPATRILDGRPLPRFVDALDARALAGARIGVLEAYFGTDSLDAPAGAVVRAALARMGELGAQVVPLEIPMLDSLNRGAGVIDLEFKWDLADYLAGVRDAPVDSLGDILGRGLLHESLVATMTRRNAPTERNSEAYRTALARREGVRAAVVAALDRERLDALVYPTMNRPPAPVGQGQAGSNCGLSANTGLPALSVPAGFTADGLPIGLELMGRPLDDARLVGFGYAFEQAVRPRRAPRSTPALAAGSAPPVRGAPSTGPGLMPPSSSPARVDVALTLDRSAGTVGYEVTVVGVRAEDVYAVVIRREATEAEASRWRVVERISGPGVTQATGVWKPNAATMERLLAGELTVELYARGQSTALAAQKLTP